MKDPLVSFVIPTHNCGAWINHAVDSCRKQKYPNIELVIVDDFSTDSSNKYLEWLKDQKVSLIRIVSLKSNMGISEARNIGNSAASGNIICVLDADDYSAPKRALWTVEKIRSGCEFVYGSADIMDAIGNKLRESRADVFNTEKALETLENRIVHSTVGYTKEFAMKYRYRNGDISKLGLEDWAQQIEAALAGVRMDFIPQTVSAYRLLNSAISQTRNQNEVAEVKREFLSEIKGKRLIPA